MILQSRTEKFYSIEMTEEQARNLSIFFDGVQEEDISKAISRIKGTEYNRGPGIRQNIHETIQTFRLALAEYQNL